MSEVKRRRILMAACIAGLLLAMIWCASVLDDARQRALEAADDVATCQTLAQNIQQLQNKPAAAGLHKMQAMNLSDSLEEAKSTAGISEGNLQRMNPSEPRPIGQGVSRQDMEIVLHDVTLLQCVTFLHALGDGGAGLQVGEIHLTSPQNGAGATTWNARLTLEHLVYMPSAAGQSPLTEE